MNSLTDVAPSQALPHGPTKLLVDEFIWHSPDVGVIASYTPTAVDVNDHFGVFRGVDQIESFGQATVVACGAFLEAQKRNLTFDELFKMYNTAFMEVGLTRFKNFIAEGETYIAMGIIKFYKFRQMIVDGRIYKVPNGLNLKEYFKDYTDSKLKNFELNEDFQLVSEINGITGKAVKKSQMNQ